MNQPLSNNSTKLCFIICATGSADREAVQAALKDRLPKLNEKKRLEFDIRYDMYERLYSLTLDTKETNVYVKGYETKIRLAAETVLDTIKSLLM